jgi:hypothetical protein
MAAQLVRAISRQELLAPTGTSRGRAGSGTPQPALLKAEHPGATCDDDQR